MLRSILSGGTDEAVAASLHGPGHRYPVSLRGSPGRSGHAAALARWPMRLCREGTGCYPITTPQG